jgi:predicted deacylase
MKSPSVGGLASLVSVAATKTVYTGDTLSGYTVISCLHTTDVSANTISQFWLSAAQAQGGVLNYLLPIFIARGTNASLIDGGKLSLSASIHGDELNGIPVVQRVFASLNETVTAGDFNGTVIGIPTMNPNGNLLNQRNIFTNSGNGFLTNLNRVFPGESITDGGSLPTAYAYEVWNNIWSNLSKVDIVVDIRKLLLSLVHFIVCLRIPVCRYATIVSEGSRTYADIIKRLVQRWALARLAMRPEVH